MKRFDRQLSGKKSPSRKTGNISVAQKVNYSNNPDPNGKLTPSINRSTEENPNTVLEVFLDNALEAVEENPTKRWMEIAAPILKSGGKTVPIILSLGFISIPLMISGTPWIGIILALGASITAICSSLR